MVIIIVYPRETKLRIHCSSKVPKRYKRNLIKGDLHRSKKIATDFQKEVTSVRKKYLKVDYPIKFINNVINEFCNETESIEDSYIIPSNLFKEEKRVVMVEIPCCEKNEKKSKDFLKKLYNFTGDNFRLVITWKARKRQTLFSVKRKKPLSFM